MSDTRTVLMNADEIRETASKQFQSGEISLEQWSAIEKSLKALEYRAEYNQRATVKMARRAYNKKQNEARKAGRQLIAGLLKR